MIWYVAVGGTLGSVARFVLSGLIQQSTAGVFPLGTPLSNITGSFLPALLMEYALATPAASREVRAMLTTGFCGGYTTFSTFSYEATRLMQEGDYRRAGLYVALSVAASVGGAIAGFGVAREVLAVRRLV